MTTILRAFALFIAVSTLPTCATVTTDNPVGMSGGAEADTRLIGGWKVITNDHSGYVFFIPRQGGGLQAVLVGWEPGSDTKLHGEWWIFDILTGKAGRHTLINARPVLQGGDAFPKMQQPNADGYLPLLYRFETDGSVEFFDWSDGHGIIDAIKGGQIAGTVEGTDVEPNVHITADLHSLDAFFAEAAPRLLPNHFATLQPIDSASRSFDNEPVYPSFDASEGTPKPDSEVAIIRAGEAVSIRSLTTKDGQPIYDIGRNGAANPIRLQPGPYQITLQVTFNKCDGCVRTSNYTVKAKPGHSYVWRKDESRYGSWIMSHTDETGAGVEVVAY